MSRWLALQGMWLLLTIAASQKPTQRARFRGAAAREELEVLRRALAENPADNLDPSLKSNAASFVEACYVPNLQWNASESCAQAEGYDTTVARKVVELAKALQAPAFVQSMSTAKAGRPPCALQTEAQNP